MDSERTHGLSKDAHLLFSDIVRLMPLTTPLEVVYACEIYEAYIGSLSEERERLDLALGQADKVIRRFQLGMLKAHLKRQKEYPNA